MNTKTLILHQFTDIEEERATINRLLAAAVVSRKFCSLLLTDPRKAVTTGFGDEQFDLSPHTSAILTSIQAVSLSEFAAALIHELRWLNDPLVT